MRILHFSDLHLMPNNGLLRSQRLLDKMLSSLVEINAKRHIDLVIFSGDIVDKGAKGFDSIDVAFGNFKHLIVEKIVNSLHIGNERVIIVPGNHDIERNLDKAFVEDGIQLQLTSNSSVDEFVHDDSSMAEVKRISAFNKFQHSYYQGIEGIHYKCSSLQSNLILNIDKKKVGITMLNSVWRCYDSKKDKGKLLFSKAQFIDSEDCLKDCDIRIAVSHHAPNWMSDFESLEDYRLITKNYHMFFCGHTHGSDAELHCRPEGNTFFFTAPGLLCANIDELSRAYTNGFMIIDYDDDSHVVSASKYYQEFDNSFVIDRNFCGTGIWKTDIPRGELALLNDRLLDTYSTIERSIPNLNNHLIGYRTSTNSPKIISDIFVMPKLQYREQTNDDVETVKSIEISAIEDLLKLDGNVIIYGGKEAGKTILIDKILIDIINNHRVDNIMPIRIDFSSIKNNLIQLIGGYWDQSTRETNILLSKKELLLLVDDIDFSEENEYKLKSIASFLEKYPHSRLIGTSLGRNTVAFSCPQKDIIPSCRSLQIKSFQAEQIRELASKWYRVPEEDESLRDKIEFIIKAFRTFKLPSTPFSVTLLLWILEKGGQIQPTNSAVLLDAFMLEMLKDASGGLSKEKFNQSNKLRLLSVVAYTMIVEEDNSISENRAYSFTYGKLSLLVEQHLKEMELTVYKPNRIIDSLIDAGILVQDETSTNIYFRFRCFMEYFLAKQMSISEEFFNYVLSERNYLDFSNVINYYTGFSSDKSEFFNFLY